MSITASIYRDVEVQVTVSCKTTIKSSIGDFSNNVTDTKDYTLSGENIEKVFNLINSAAQDWGLSEQLTVQRFLEVAFTDEYLIQEIASGTYDDRFRERFFHENQVFDHRC